MTGNMSGMMGGSGVGSTQKSTIPSIYTGLLNTSHFRADLQSKTIVEETIVKPNLQYFSMGGKKDLAPPPRREKNKYKVISGNKTDRTYTDNTLVKKEQRHANNNPIANQLIEKNNVRFFFILLLYFCYCLLLVCFLSSSCTWTSLTAFIKKNLWSAKFPVAIII